MGGIIGALIGLPIAVFGFLVMRNPMRLTLLAPRQKGYYQRMALDPAMRIQLRVLGALLSLFGGCIGTVSLGSVLRISVFYAASDGLVFLMGLVFCAAFAMGVVVMIRQLVRGELLNWWQMWMLSMRSDAIEVFPAVTPRMQKEATVFTIALVVLASIAIGFALLGKLP
jgi:hypothetical protein